jgi:hypothetical protein
MTDSPFLARKVAENSSWVPVLLPQSKYPQIQQRRLKILSRKAEGTLANHGAFDIVVYHDGKAGISGETRKLRGARELGQLQVIKPTDLSICIWERKLRRSFDLIVRGNAELLAYAHTERIMTVEEMEAVADLKLCSEGSIASIRKLHRAEGYPDNIGLADTQCLVWKASGSSLATLQGMTTWFNTMEMTGCMRDQLNFEYAMWKHNVSYMLLHTDKSPFWKVRNHARNRTLYQDN